jgi:hypothetical protein
MKQRFLTRNPDRDRRNDLLRFSRLQQVLGEIDRELLAERDGFEKRYRSASVDAAFSQERLEDSGEGEALSARVDHLTGTLIDFTQRMADLDRQIAYIETLRVSVDGFTAHNALSRPATSPDEGGD